MERKRYEQTEDYKKAVGLFEEFVTEVLDGNIEALARLDFSDLMKFTGAGDPDDFLITKAIYIILWGDIFDLTFENMGAWNLKNTKPFRGDTMNSFGSLIGKEDKSKGKEFGFRAKFFGADKKEQLWQKIEEFHKLYHYVGNFIVLPNRSTAVNGINGARASYYDTDELDGMRDYFDWFLVKLAEYQERISAGTGHTMLGKFDRQLQMNPEYHPVFLPISEWETQFFLEPYFENGKPKQLFQTPFQDRLKVTAPPKDRKNNGKYFGNQEYLELLEDYLDKSKGVILYRTGRMVEELKKVLR